jgi:hypothetical protein
METKCIYCNKKYKINVQDLFFNHFIAFIHNADRICPFCFGTNPDLPSKIAGFRADHPKTQKPAP